MSPRNFHKKIGNGSGIMPQNFDPNWAEMKTDGKNWRK